MSPPAESPPPTQRTQRNAPKAVVPTLVSRPPLWKRLLHRLQGRTHEATASTMLPVLMEVFAGFSKIDGEVMEEEIDSSLGFMRYDYPEAIYSELRRIYFEALQNRRI